MGWPDLQAEEASLIRCEITRENDTDGGRSVNTICDRTGDSDGRLGRVTRTAGDSDGRLGRVTRPAPRTGNAAG